MFFDTHCHLDLKLDSDDWKVTVNRAIQSGVSKLNNIAEQENAWLEVLDQAKEFPDNIYATLGVHPIHTSELYYREKRFEVLAKLKNNLKNRSVVGIGEAGLDYYYLDKDSEKQGISVNEIKNIQNDYFEKFIQLAMEENKTLVMHCRDAYGTDEREKKKIISSSEGGRSESSAYDDFYEILRSKWSPDQRGVVHFYIGSVEMMKKLLDLGLYIGFTGVITFPNTSAYEENVRNIPIDRMVIETDSPFVAPQKHRGQVNEPAFVVEVAKKIAEIKGMTLEEVGKITSQNAMKLFNIIA